MDEHKHYICTGGCGAISETLGSCQDENCTKHGQAFIECDCTDGKHHAEKEEEPKEEIF